jgi:hypothetical protein
VLSSSGKTIGSEITLEQAIAALKSGDISHKNLNGPLTALNKLPVDSRRRDEVSALLDPLLTTENLTLRRGAQRAMAGWGTKKNITTLMKLLEWQAYGDRWEAMKALAAIGGSKEAAQAIAARMRDKDDRLTAKRTLEEMGPVAEDVVWQYIGGADDSLHGYACDVLGKVGTSKSLIKLKALRPEKDSGRRSDVNDAIREMQKRLTNSKK